MNVDKKKYTLILNRNFYPLSVEGIKRTVKYFLDGAEAFCPVSYEKFTFDQWVEKFTIKEESMTIRSEKLWLKIPEILILQSTHIPSGSRRFSKKKVFVRDCYTCGYCGSTLKSETKTIDHVIPVSKGGKTKYNNVISCCTKCNSIKSDRSYQDMKKNYGWTMRHSLTNPDQNILYHVPASKVLKCWEPFLEKSS